jgi:hypothetical protein
MTRRRPRSGLDGANERNVEQRYCQYAKAMPLPVPAAER